MMFAVVVSISEIISPSAGVFSRVMYTPEQRADNIAANREWNEAVAVHTRLLSRKTILCADPQKWATAKEQDKQRWHDYMLRSNYRTFRSEDPSCYNP